MDSNVDDDVEPQRSVWTAEEEEEVDEVDCPRDRSHSWMTLEDEAKRGDFAWCVRELKAFLECHVSSGCEEGKGE